MSRFALISAIVSMMLISQSSAATLVMQNGKEGYDGCSDSYVYKRHSSSPLGDEVPQGGNDLLVEEDQA